MTLATLNSVVEANLRAQQGIGEFGGIAGIAHKTVHYLDQDPINTINNFCQLYPTLVVVDSYVDKTDLYAETQIVQEFISGKPPEIKYEYVIFYKIPFSSYTKIYGAAAANYAVYKPKCYIWIL